MSTTTVLVEETRMLPADCVEELECLQAIYWGSQHENLELEPSIDPSSSTLPLRIKFSSYPVLLSFTLPSEYPQKGPQNIRIDSQGIGMSRLQMFELQMRMESVIFQKAGEILLFDLTSEICDFAARVRGDIYLGPLEDEQDEEEEDEEDEEYIEDQRVDPSVANHFLGTRTIANIMKEIPRVGLLHSELILRRDLLNRFERVRSMLSRKHSSRFKDRRAQDAAVDEYSKVEIVFHGTLRHNISSIVRNGFIVPGQATKDGVEVGVRCGSTWGKGIYTSPDPDFSLAYTDWTTGGIPGQKLIVCAALLGRKRQRSFRGEDEKMDGYDSVVSPCQKEYVVFDSAQILPLYVLHVGDARQALAPVATQVIGEEDHELATLSTKMRHRLLTARARKHFPLGFGPKGANFVVEAVADVDEDEEQWGEFLDESRDEFKHDRLQLW